MAIEKRIGNYIVEYESDRYKGSDELSTIINSVKFYKDDVLIAEAYDDEEANFIAKCLLEKETIEYNFEQARKLIVDYDNGPIIERA